MIPIVQEIDFKTISGHIAKAEIQRINDLSYICFVYSDNTKGSFSTLPQISGSSAEECFKILLEQIEKIISAQYDGDSLVNIDNKATPYITKLQEQIICSPSITILVDGL
jgi:hypothetical protein